MRRLLIKKNQRNSRIKNSRIASTMIDRVCVTKSIRSMNVIIWSKNFVRLNENRTKKWWKKSKKFLKQTQELERQWNEFAKTSKNDWKKSSKKRMTQTTNRREKKSFFDDEMTLNVSFTETFAKRQVSYKLINCWTLNSDIDIHVCNDSDRFQLNRVIDSNDQLVINKIVYDIENYETMNIVVKKFDDSINIQLLNVALMFEFFISLICLIKMMKKKIHWNIENKKLHRKEVIFCFVESIEDHWILENNLSNQTFETFEVKSEAFKFDFMITNRKWHEMLEHSRSKIIVHLVEKVNEIKIDDLESASSINKCETCAFIKTHEIVFRRIDQKESINHSLNRIDYDLISMNEKYNDDFWVNHFIDFYIKMNFVYTYSRKKTTHYRWFENFWKRFRSNTIKSFDLYEWTMSAFWDSSIENLWNCERSSWNDSLCIRHLRMIKSNDLRKYWWSELKHCE
jgi:hypothetical protein